MRNNSLNTSSAPVFTVVVPVMNQHDVTRDMMESWFANAKGRIRILFIDNGSDSPLQDQQFFKTWSRSQDVRVIRNPENVGVYPTFQQGYDHTDTQFIFYSHNDVQMIEWGWDEKLARLLRTLETPGVCGMFGAKGIGTHDIYKAPYHYTQMMRWDCITVQSMLDAGARLIMADYERIMVLDGFSLIVNSDMIRSAFAFGGRFDHERFPVHHMYDQDICVTSHYGGFKNYVLDIDCRHHGGVTSTRERWAEPLGSTDLKIHREAHRVFYEKWRGRLPVSV